MPPERSDTVDAVHGVKQEIDRLTEEESNAVQLAIYVGMSGDEAKKYEEQLRPIKRLVAELSRLCEKR